MTLDNDFISLLEYYQSRNVAAEEVRVRRKQVVADILQRHKVAMHWQLVAKIAIESEPTLFPSPRAVQFILASDSHWFAEEDSGLLLLRAAALKGGLGLFDYCPNSGSGSGW